MDFISAIDVGLILAKLWTVITVVLVFLPILAVIIIVHEMGHFLVARFFGVTVETFSIGFGREIASFVDRYGTKWRIALVPMGGYVKFKGDENAASMPSPDSLGDLSEDERRGNLHAKPIGQRAAIVAAGPIANFVLAIVILTFWFMFVGKPIVEARVDKVEPGSAAAEAGFQPGDVVTKIGGTAIRSFDEIPRIVMMSAGTTFDVTVVRNGQTVEFKATPRLVETKDRSGNTAKVGQLGISRATVQGDVTVQYFGPVGAFVESLHETWFWLKQPVIVIQKLFTREVDASQIGGPIGMARLSHEIFEINPVDVIRLTAIISIQIGFMNLLPIPILDGGHLLFYGLEAIRGRRLSERTMEIGFRIGFAFVIMLMLFATRNDLMHWFRKLG